VVGNKIHAAGEIVRMRRSLINSLALGMLMVSSSVLTITMKPVLMVSRAEATKINLETIIPDEFDGWRLDSSNTSPIVDPKVRGELDRIYLETLSRTYVNTSGERIMLSIAYGRAQKTDMYAHRPEICYTASGFNVVNMTKTFVDTTVGRIPVMHLVARRGLRNEPITYWIRVGDTITRGWLEQNLTAIGYGLSGKVPDGLLLRVSSISNDAQDAYRVQRLFLTEMLKAVRREDLFWLVGKLSS
jgi:EpsI family protein